MSSLRNQFTDGWFALLLSSVSIILMVVIMVHFVNDQWMNSTNKIGFKFWLLPPHTLLALLTFIFYTLYVLQWVIYSSYWILYAKPTNSFYPKWCLPILFHLSPFTIGKITMYLFWFIRLKQVFQSTAFALSNKKLIILAITFCLPILITAR